MPHSAAVYCRISQDAKGLKAGVKRQEEDCRALAERKGWAVSEVYIDNDLSAWNGKPRPAYRRLLEDIQAGAVDAVVTYDLDRLHRRPVELEQFFQVCDGAGLRDMASVSGDVNLATDDGRFHARILGAVAKKSSDDTSRRLKRKMEDLARQGKPKGSRRPFGYEDDLMTVRKAEARLIREAADRVLAGEGLRGICMDWRSRGVSTTTGKGLWTNHQLKRVLLSPRIAGFSIYRGEVVGKAQWPAILNPSVQDRLRAILKDSSRGQQVGARSYLLAGFGYCGLCNGRLYAKPLKNKHGEKRRCYVCSKTFGGCGKILVTAEPLEDLVAEASFIALDSPRLREALEAGEQTDSQQGRLLDGLREDETALEQLARDHYADRLITRSEYLAARTPIESRMKTTRERLEKRARQSVITGLPVGADALRSAWAERDLDWRRALIGTVIEKVTVKPAQTGANKFDPRRVDIVWRV